MTRGSSVSATLFATNTASITGTAYVKVFVSSNMITATDTVVRVTPDKLAAAPIMAYRPGMTQFKFPLQLAKTGLSGYLNCAHCTRIPTIRPAQAPTRAGV